MPPNKKANARRPRPFSVAKKPRAFTKKVRPARTTRPSATTLHSRLRALQKDLQTGYTITHQGKSRGREYVCVGKRGEGDIEVSACASLDEQQLHLPPNLPRVGKGYYITKQGRDFVCVGKVNGTADWLPKNSNKLIHVSACVTMPPGSRP